MGVWHFEQNAGLNATADSPNTYLAEGQAAHTLNNSVRGALKSIAEWRDDNNGLLTATRAGGVYSLTSYQAINALTKPITLAFFVDLANTGPSNLALNGMTSKALRRPGNIDLGPDDLQPAILYRAVYNVTLGVYLITSPHIERPGRLIPVAAATAEPGTVLCYGQALSRATYKALYDRIGTTWGVGDGSTTFNVPDLRGRAVFGLDNMGGTATGRLTATSGAAATAVGVVGGSELTQSHGHSVNEVAHNHTINDPTHSHTVNDPAHFHSISDPGHVHSDYSANGASTLITIGTGITYNLSNAESFLSTSSSVTGIGINFAYTGITLAASFTGISNNAAVTGISVNAYGSGTTQNMPPFGACLYAIKV